MENSFSSCLKIFYEFTKLVNEKLNLYPVLIGDLALNKYFYNYFFNIDNTNKIKIEILIKDDYIKGLKKEEWFQFLKQNGYKRLNNQEFRKDGYIFQYDSFEKYNINYGYCKRISNCPIFERKENKIIWKKVINYEYHILPFDDFKKIYEIKNNQQMLNKIVKLKQDLENEQLFHFKWEEDNEIRNLFENYLITNNKDKTFIKKIATKYKRTLEEIQDMFNKYRILIEKENICEKEESFDFLEIVYGEAAGGAIKTTSFKNNKILTIGFPFNIGKLDNTRKEFLKEYFKFDYRHIEELKRKKRLLDYYLKKAKTIRIWSSHKDDKEYLLLLYLCNYIDDDREIYVTFADTENYISICYLNGEQIEKIAKKEHKLTKKEKEYYKKEWRRLIKENGEIRFIENNKIKSVSFSYFDNAILEILKKLKDSSLVSFIGDLLGNNFLNNVGDLDYIYLINRLIKENKIEVISDGHEFLPINKKSDLYKIIRVK